jgi:hypothetical protein
LTSWSSPAPGDAGADVAAAGDHDAPDRLQHAPQLAHHGRMCSLAASTKTSSPPSMTVLPSGSTGWCSRKMAAMRASTLGQVLAHGLDRLADQQAAVVGAHADQRHPAVGELEHLQGFGELDQA